jgi:outer membrane protein
MKNLFLSAFLLCAVSLSGFSQDAPNRLNLNQCIEIALKNNVGVQRSNIAAENARVDLQESRANLLPSISAGVTHGLNQGRSIDPISNTYVNQEATFARPYLNGELLLFNGMAMQNLIKKNSLAFQASKQEEQRDKDNLTLQVTLTYLQVLTSQDVYGLAKTQQEITAKQVERLEVLNANGAETPSNYYDLKGQYASDNLNIITAANNLETYKVSLATLMNVPYSKELQLEQLSAEQFSLLYETNPDQVYQAAIENLAVVKAADLRKQSADFFVKQSRSAYYPQLFFSTGISSNYANTARDPLNNRIGYFDQYGNNLSKSYSIGLSIPILNGFRVKNQINRAKLTLRENELVAQSTRTQLQQLTEQAYFNMTTSKDRYLNLQDQVAAYAEAFRTIEIRFDAGAINSLEYLNAKGKLDRANIDVLTNRYDFILRKKILDFYQGKPLGM